MFTGIIQEIGILKGKKNAGNTYQLVIGCRKVLKGISRGDSIAVNGVCLTVVDYSGDSFTADVMPQTLRVTNLNSLEKGSRVNLEQAVKADGFFGGHLVTGHVDDVGWVMRIKPESNARILEIAISPDLTDFIVDKGSVALNGVSLTVMEVREDSLLVSLIPETLDSTNLNQVRMGNKINIETDLIGKYVAKMMRKEFTEARKPVIDKNFLQEKGFF